MMYERFHFYEVMRCNFERLKIENIPATHLNINAHPFDGQMTKHSFKPKKKPILIFSNRAIDLDVLNMEAAYHMIDTIQMAIMAEVAAISEVIDVLRRHQKQMNQTELLSTTKVQHNV